MQPSPDQAPLFPTERTFVVQFRATAGEEPTGYEGRVEHVVSGQARRFRTPDELLAFMAQVLRERRAPWPEEAT